MIKRGTPVIWHRPAFDEKVVDKDRHWNIKVDKKGNPLMKTVHRNAQDLEGQCFGIMRRPGHEESALVRVKGQHSMSEMPLIELEERKHE